MDVLRKHAGKVCVCELVPLFDISQPTLSHHLKKLRDAGIVDSERRKGYAKKMLHDSLGYCREIGLDRVLITCLVDNEPSRRTILSQGGVYENTVQDTRDDCQLERYWIQL